MRNKIKILPIILVFSLILPVFVLAEHDEKTEREGAHDEKTRHERVMVLKKLSDVQVKRTDKAISKLSNIIERIEKLISELKSKGTDVSSLEASVAKAKTLKAEAEKLLADTKSKYESIDPEGTQPKRQVQAFMSSMNAVKKKLIEFHKALINIVKEAKKLEVQP